MFSIKDDLMASPKVIFFHLPVTAPAPEAVHPLFPTTPLPSLSFTSHPTLSPPHHSVPHTRNLLQVQLMTVGEQRFHTETSTPDHHKLEPFPPWK